MSDNEASMRFMLIKGWNTCPVCTLKSLDDHTYAEYLNCKLEFVASYKKYHNRRSWQ